MTKVDWWMRHYHALTPKPHFAYSNSAAVSKLDLGPLKNWKKVPVEEGGVRTAEIYYNSTGEKCYKGTFQDHFWVVYWPFWRFLPPLNAAKSSQLTLPASSVRWVGDGIADDALDLAG